MENTAYLVLEDQRVSKDPPKSGLYVQGTSDDGGFSPTGDVLGEGLLGDAGQPGWLELRTGEFYGDQTARAPFPPYLRGYRSPDGKFRPSSRTITY